jgi:hypothetical protein
MENNKLEENKIQVLNADIQERIEKEESIIQEQDKIIKGALSKKELAKIALQQWQNYKPNLSSKINVREEKPFTAPIQKHDNTIERKGLNTPEFIYDNVLRILKAEDFLDEGLTVPDLEKFLKKDSITISREGIRASLNKMVDNGVAKITNPNQQRNIRYALIKSELGDLMG